ncbi:MAG: hypothetical protein GF416_06610 [Candidatus Altiarchaeales archaeon]|nr:hypothetical protein [Candidatus Altiarchaeales archaeon]MBD3416787.1 hypothetical protein [Candidatus Altiarchaeales archaeon]
MEAKNIVFSGFLVGLAVGVIAAVPVIRLCNVCCLWIFFGGFLAAYVYGRGRAVEYVDCAAVGVVFGLTYGVVSNSSLLVVGLILDALNLSHIGSGSFGLAGSALKAIIRVFLGIVLGASGSVVYAATSFQKTAKPVEAKAPKLGR